MTRRKMEKDKRDGRIIWKERRGPGRRSYEGKGKDRNTWKGEGRKRHRSNNKKEKEKDKGGSHLLQERHVESATLELINEVLAELLQGGEGPVGAESCAAQLSVRIAVLDDAEHTVAGGRAWREGEEGGGRWREGRRVKKGLFCVYLEVKFILSYS